MDEPQNGTAEQSEQEQTTDITGKINQAASRARDAVTGAKEAVVGTATARGEQAIEEGEGGCADGRRHGEGVHLRRGWRVLGVGLCAGPPCRHGRLKVPFLPSNELAAVELGGYLDRLRFCFPPGNSSPSRC